MKSADCYVNKVEIVDNSHAVVRVQPLGDSCYYGDWPNGYLDSEKEYEWQIDVAKFGMLRFVEFYVSYRLWKIGNTIPNDKFHVIIDFNDDNAVEGISNGNGEFV